MGTEEYDVALSFAGEDREKAEDLAKELTSLGLSVFYDRYEQSNLWGKDLYQHFQKVYRDQSRYCVIFVSEHYAEKTWTRHELKNAQARALQENQEYILPLRLDQTELPGINETIGYINIEQSTLTEIAQMIAEKLRDRKPSISEGCILELKEIHYDFVHALDFSQDDRYLVSGSKDFSVNVFDIQMNRTVQNFQSKSLESWCVRIAGNYLVAGFWQKGIIQIWDTAEWVLIKEIYAHPLSVRSVEFTPDYKFLASCAHDGKIKLWQLDDLNQTEPVVEISAHQSPCTSISFSPDGQFLSSSGDEGTVIIWNLQDRNKVYTFEADVPSHALSVKYTVDGKYIVACFADITPKSKVGHCVKVFNASSGQVMHTLTSHTNWVWCLAIHPNNTWVASGGWDGKVVIWDIETGRQKGEILASLDRIYAVAFSYSGNWIATAGWDNCVRIWDVNKIISSDGN
jgi:WD40 repeat protein